AEGRTARERLTVGRIGEQVAADGAIKDPRCAVNDSASARIWGPGEADPRRDMTVAVIDAACRYARIAREQNALRETGGDGGLCAGNEVHGHELGIGRRGLDVVTDTEID